MDTVPLHDQLTKALGHFRKEITAIRAGQASPSVIENILVESYGTKTPLQSLASITVADAQTLTVQPWDRNIMKDIEKALASADIGSSPVVDGELIRISFPPLTEERREEFVKLVNKKSEETKISGKNLREEFLKELKTAALSEDAKKRVRDDVKKKVDEFHNSLKEVTDTKVGELRTL